MAQDTHQQAIEEFDDAHEDINDVYERMRADLRFSDPTNPQQWERSVLNDRKGRVSLVFDRTNQFVSQVVNQMRQNKPAIHCLPSNSEAAIEVAEQLNGIIRHIEYVSRADIAYDTAGEYAARIGLGWMRVVPEIMRPETNEQEIRIKRIADPLSCYLEAGWSEPDGSDAMVGFIETMMPKKAFQARWPKAQTDSWERGAQGWFDEKQIRIVERFKIIETKTNKLTVEMDGQERTLGEDEYWALCKQIGFKIPVTSQFEAKIRSVKWSKLSGCEVLEETEFPSQYLPLIPMVGHDLMVDGKRKLGGMVRRLMPAQMAYNYERSAFIEAVAMQPKAPLMASIEAMEGLDAAYKSLHQGNPAVLPYNGLDAEGKQIEKPTRLEPPVFPVAFAQGGQIATTDMESAVGMFSANLGAKTTQAVSGRAKREDKVAGDTANFHYTDNRDRSIAQMGRVVVDMIPRVYDTKRMARILGEDGSQDFVKIDPEMGDSHQKQGKKVIAINPSKGSYDVMVKSGPAYTTLREEQAEQLAQIMQAAPNTVPILADLWVAAQDFPDAEKAQKRLALMLPPEVQQAEADEGEEIPPAVQAQMKLKDGQIAQLTHALETAHAEHMDLENQTKAGTQAKLIDAQSKEKMKAQDARMESMRLSAQVYIAELNAGVVLAGQGTDAATAFQALQAEHVLEGKKISADMQKHQQSSQLDAAKHVSTLGAEAQSQDKQLGVDLHKHETGLQAQSQAQAADHQAQAQTQDKALSSAEKLAKAKPKAKA